MQKKKKTSRRKKALKIILGIFFAFLVIILLRIVYFETFDYHPTPFVGRLLGKTPVGIELKWLHNAQFAGIYAGLKNEYFEDRDLVVTLYERDFSNDSVTDTVASGKVDFGITNALDVIDAVSKGKKIKAIAAVYQHSPGAAASLKKTEITSPEDFPNKKIGISSDNPGVRLFYNYLLNMHNIPKDSVTFLEVGPRQTDALLDGTVDILAVYRTDESFALTSQGVPFRLMLPEAHGLDLYGDLIITSDKMIKENPEVVKKFVGGVVQGWQWALENQEEALAASSVYAKPPYDNIWRQRYILTNSQPLIKPTSDSVIGEMDKRRWEKTIEMLKTYDVLSKNILPEELFTNEFLPKN